VCVRVSGLEPHDVKVEPLNRLAEVAQLSVYQANGRAYRAGTLARRINALAFRPLRMVMKGVKVSDLLLLR